MTELFNLAAQVKLSRRLKNLLRIDENVEIDTSYITCAEYQLFIDEKRTFGINFQPDHWPDYRFSIGESKKPIAGIRANDAESFCQWLTQSNPIPGFRYRLLTIHEIQEYPIIDNHIGAWCMDGVNRIIAGIETEQRQTWQKEFVELLARDLAPTLDHTLKRTLDHTKSSARNHILNHTIDRALHQTLNRIHPFDLDLARAITLARGIDFNTALNRTRGLDLNLGRTHIRILTGDHDIDLARTLGLSRTLNHIRDLALQLAQERDNAFNLDFDFARFLNHDRVRILKQGFFFKVNFQPIRSYLLLMFTFWVLLRDLYIQLSKNQKVLEANQLILKGCKNISEQYATKEKQVFNLYAFFVLMALRREGKIPAWEGIRIARERIDT